ncbi:MAG: hydroxymethylglutaryl-CoA synthase [Myxococcales bacterium]|nr:hydroxymethylglutaryl-CoA synthase [Myxococcales bacterium]
MNGAILDLAVAIPHHYVSHKELAQARGVEADKYHRGLGCDEMAICGPGEDTVTLAAEAAWRLFEHNPEARERIGLCIVGTESGVDAAKPVAIYVHRLLGLPANCRAFEIKHACYGATAALQMASSWVQQHPKRLALVIASDIARYERGSAGEPTQGAGAVAMLVGKADERDALLQLSPISGAFANDVYDFWRPPYQSEALVKGKYSMNCYLEGLQGAYEDYCRQAGDEPTPDYLLYHVPFPAMARKAHRRMSDLRGLSDELYYEDLESRVEPALWANRKVGNVYSGSLYLALAGLCERKGTRLIGRRLALFSYGSGSCSEYFTGRFGEGVHRYHRHLQHLLDTRTEVDVDQYELLHDASLKMERNNSFQSALPHQGQAFTFLGIRDHERCYRQNFAEDAVALIPARPTILNNTRPFQRA